jgi:hypothetical protein
MPCLVCTLRGMCNWIIGLSSLCLLLNAAAFVIEQLMSTTLLELLLFILVLRLLYKFKEPVRSYRRCLLPVTVFEIIVQLCNILTSILVQVSGGESLKALRLARVVTFGYFGYLIWAMIKIKRENSNLQAPYEMYSLLGSSVVPAISANSNNVSPELAPVMAQPEVGAEDSPAAALGAVVASGLAVDGGTPGTQ